MWGTLRTRGTYSGGEAAVGGCSWWGHTGPALHPLESRPRTAGGRDTVTLKSVLKLLVVHNYFPYTYMSCHL